MSKDNKTAVKPVSNTDAYKLAQEEIKSLLVKADANGVEVDPIDIETAINFLRDSSGNYEAEGLVANSLYRVGQAVGLVASPVTCLANLILPEAFQAGFRAGNGTAQRFYRNTFNKVSDKTAEIANKYAGKLQTRPAQPTTVAMVTDANTNASPATL